MNSVHQPSTNIDQPKLKVCGLTKLDQIRELIALNIDFLGFIFYEKSPRYVLNHLRLKQIAEIPHTGKVGVFVNEKVEKIIEISEQANLNFIQLHGDEDENTISELREKLNPEIGIIKVIRVRKSESPKVREDIEKVFDKLRLTTNNQQLTTDNYVLFDTDSKAFGGTGQTFDWNMLNEIDIPLPYFLSGGISLENIHQLSTINHQPFSLDINSKFETEPGNKDVEKIKQFIKLYEAKSTM